MEKKQEKNVRSENKSSGGKKNKEKFGREVEFLITLLQIGCGVEDEEAIVRQCIFGQKSSETIRRFGYTQKQMFLLTKSVETQLELSFDTMD